MPPRASSSSSSRNPSSSKKRKAAPDEADSNDPPPPPSPSSSFFFEDGNVLLHVESTLFRVHRGVLKRAEVFADTLLVESAGQGEEGGIPTIKLEDSVKDWDLFLRALYDGLSFFQQFPTLLETRSLLVRVLADKYNHTSILTSATASFVARAQFEERRSASDSSQTQPNPYEHDEGFPFEEDDVLRALLAIQEEFGIEKSSVRWIHNHLADLSPASRAEFIRIYEGGSDEGRSRTGWFLRALYPKTRFSILLRVDAFALLAAKCTTVRELHVATCPLDSPCRVDWNSASESIYRCLARQSAYDDTLRVGLKIIEKAEETSLMKKECLWRVRQLWRIRRDELNHAMEKDFDP